MSSGRKKAVGMSRLIGGLRNDAGRSVETVSAGDRIGVGRTAPLAAAH